MLLLNNFLLLKGNIRWQRGTEYRQKNTSAKKGDKAIFYFSRCVHGFNFLCTEVAITTHEFPESSMYYSLETMIMEVGIFVMLLVTNAKGSRHD